MGPDKIADYQRSIKFEFIRAQMAFSEFFYLSSKKYSQLTSTLVSSVDVQTKLKYFDTYARWCGHVYEVIKARAIINHSVPVYEDSKAASFDVELQKEVDSLVAMAERIPGVVYPSLSANFSSDLRKVRNKCSFHCTNDRVKINILLDFMKEHHQEIFFVFKQMNEDPEMLGVEELNDFGALGDFYDFNYSPGQK